jgi:hypothetical protein
MNIQNKCFGKELALALKPMLKGAAVAGKYAFSAALIAQLRAG